MGGSQLKQLKSALQTAGLGRNSSQSKKKQRSSRQSGKDTIAGDPDARQKKLQAISQTLNKFDVKTTKTKHQIVNAKPTKGATGRPGLSKQTGIENRRKTLLPEFLDRNRSGGILDRRFGEGDSTLTPEDKALQRFTLERQRNANKRSMFNLDDDADGEDLLTHYGQSLSEAPAPLRDQEDMYRQAMTEDAAEESDAPARKKTKAQVMEEVIAKSKAYKHERQRVRDLDDDLRMELDNELASVRSLLGAPIARRPAPDQPPQAHDTGSAPDGFQSSTKDVVEPRASSATSGTLNITFVPANQVQAGGVDRSVLDRLLNSAEPEVQNSIEQEGETSRDPVNEDNDDDVYDRFVRELAFDKRAQPSDRLRSAAEVAQEAASALERAERDRLKRMRGEVDVDAEETVTSRHSSSSRRPPEGDDLGDDDFEDGQASSAFGFGTGLGQYEEDGSVSEIGSEDVDLPESAEIQDHEEDSEGSDLEEGGDAETDESATSEDDGETAMLADLLHGESDENASESGDMAQTLVSSARRSAAGGDGLRSDEIPYTFPCPQSHDEFLDILEPLADGHLLTVIERIRTLHHPSLAEGNKLKMAGFLRVLLDHMLYLADDPSTSGNERRLAVLVHALQMVKIYPLTSTTYFISKLRMMQRNLARGLASDPSLTASKTWPGPAELMLLRLVGVIWSTSDFSHPVVAPAMLLLCQYLDQCRIRDLRDLASGLFLCTLVLQYEAQSKRFVPEVINFLGQAITILFSLPEKVASELDLFLPESKLHDRLHPTKPQSASSVDKKGKQVAAPQFAQASIPGLWQEGPSGEGLNDIHMTHVALSLVRDFAEAYTGLPAFIEIFSPFTTLLDAFSSKDYEVPRAVQPDISKTLDMLSRMLKFARQSRRPLTLQSHKPIPIPSYVPKFDAGYQPGRHFDPDSERNEAAKLKALVRKEKKGAIRELRKDARFIAGEKARIQRERDDEYRTKINRITAGLEQERSEEKRFERIKEKSKARDKKRAGKSGR